MLIKCERCGEEFEAEKIRGKYPRFCPKDHYDNCPICGKSYVVRRDSLDKPPVCCSYKCRSIMCRRTSLEKYGCLAPGNNPEARKKASETMMKKLGVPYAQMNKDVRDKSKNTLVNKYGVDNIAKNPEYKMKAVHTSIEKYGKLAFNLPESYEKQHKTIMERYGVRTALEIPHVQLLTHNRISKMNLDLKDKLEKLGYTCQLEYNINGSYFDIYIENTPYLIELNPTFTHTQYADPDYKYNNKYYHRNRSILAESIGLQCICIWDWDNITKILGTIHSNSTRNVSDLKIFKLNADVANKFLEENDLKGPVKSEAIHLGAVKGDEILAIISFAKSRYNKNFNVELIRYTKKLWVDIPGVFDLLSSEASRTYEITKCITYMDYSKPYNQKFLEEMNMKFSHFIQPVKILSKGSKFYTRSLIERKFNTVSTIKDENGWKPIYTCGSKAFIFE